MKFLKNFVILAIFFSPCLVSATTTEEPDYLLTNSTNISDGYNLFVTNISDGYNWFVNYLTSIIEAVIGSLKCSGSTVDSAEESSTESHDEEEASKYFYQS